MTCNDIWYTTNLIHSTDPLMLIYSLTIVSVKKRYIKTIFKQIEKEKSFNFYYQYEILGIN